MIWLINAEIFIDNFSIRSLVNSKLRENEHWYNFYLFYITVIEDSLIDYNNKIWKLNQDIKSTISEINWQQKKYNDLKNYLAENEKSIVVILSSKYIYGDLCDFKSEFITQLNNNKTDYNELVKSKTDVIKSIDIIFLWLMSVGMG